LPGLNQDQWFVVFGLVIAGLGVAVPLLTSAVTGVFKQVTLNREQRQREWARLSELLDILENHAADKHGELAQLAAIHELAELSTKVRVVIPLVQRLSEVWTPAEHPRHAAALNALLLKLNRR